MGQSVVRGGTGSSNQGPAAALLATQRKEEVAAGTTETAVQCWGLQAAVLLSHRQQQQKWVWPRLPVGPALKHGGSLQKDQVPNGLQLWRKGHVEVTATAD